MLKEHLQLRRPSAAAARLLALTGGAPIAAYVVTGVVWFPLLVSGILYPLFDAGNLQSSWGGPRSSGRG